MVFKAATLLTTCTLIYIWAPLMMTSECYNDYPITLVVYNSLTKQENLTFTTDIKYRGILLGAMKKVQANSDNFKFTITEDPNYGPFLESVNGLAGSSAEQTYWEILVQPKNGIITTLDVGIGCYIPNPEDTVIFKFTTY